MITNIVLLLLYAVIFVFTLPFRALSDVTVPSLFVDTFSNINQYLTLGNSVLPRTVTAILLTWGVYLTIEGLIFIYKGVRWVYNKIPGIS